MIKHLEPITIVVVVWCAFILSTFFLIYVYGLYRNLRNRIRKIPPSKISSLSMGRVEVSGVAKFDSKGCLFSPYSKTKCCYYYATTRSCNSAPNSNEITSDRQASYEPFILSDDGVECLVFPKKAILKGKNFKVQQFKSGGYIYTETLILPGMPLFIDGICAFDESIDTNKKFEKLFHDSIDSTIELTGDNDRKLIIRAPNKEKDTVNFKFIISTISREDLIKSYIHSSKLLVILVLVLGSIALLLSCN